MEHDKPHHCRMGDDNTAFAQMQLLFSYRNRHGKEMDAAFVRWYTQDKARVKKTAGLRLARLKWEFITVRGMGLCPRTDAISLGSIIGPCFLQPDPTNSTANDKDKRFYYNHWVGNTAEGF